LVKRLAVLDVDLCVGCQSCMMACNRRFGCAGTAKSAIHVRSVGGIEKGFIVVVCKACVAPSCIRVCPTDALTNRSGGGVVLDVSRCIGCKHCVDACTIGAVFWDDANEKPMICVHCGYCVEYCPYGVLQIEQTEQVLAR
jgi:Fe-S-cluster-containing dehydrogenase component